MAKPRAHDILIGGHKFCGGQYTARGRSCRRRPLSVNGTTTTTMTGKRRRVHEKPWKV